MSIEILSCSRYFFGGGSQLPSNLVSIMLLNENDSVANIKLDILRSCITTFARFTFEISNNTSILLTVNTHFFCWLDEAINEQIEQT